MIIKPGEKIHVIIRRRFENDLRRHFIGNVIETDGILTRAEGYTFVLDTITNQYVRRIDKRTRIIGLSDAGNIINILPANADLESAKYHLNSDHRLIVTDEKTFALDINEFGMSS